MSFLKKIKNIKLPDTDVYYERSSADGYAFFGNALQTLGMNNDIFPNEVKKRNFSLNARKSILGTPCSKDNVYVYTNWVCYEYARSLNDKATMSLLLSNIKSVGTYENGWQRYCSEEINYIIPNVTSAASMIYAENGYEPYSKKLFEQLKNNQSSGNWRYYVIKDAKLLPKGEEDNFHIGLMLYHFYRLRAYHNDANMIKSTLIHFLMSGNNWIQEGAIGWGIPTAYLVYNLYKDEIIDILGFDNFNNRNNILYHKTTKYLNHKNFRVRAIAAWALSIIYKL